MDLDPAVAVPGVVDLVTPHRDEVLVPDVSRFGVVRDVGELAVVPDGD